MKPGRFNRSATDIANSGVPVKVGMALTAHKTVTMFMKYVHTEDDPVRSATEAVNQRRQALLGRPSAPPPPISTPAPVADVSAVAPEVEAIEAVLRATGKPLGYEDVQYASRTKLGNYRPFRHRSGKNRAVPPGTKRQREITTG